jgi:hypothetical protein
MDSEFELVFMNIGWEKCLGTKWTRVYGLNHWISMYLTTRRYWSFL